MTKKNTRKQKTIAFIALIITIGLFLSALFLPLSETIQLTISIVMVISMILWVSFASGGYPSLARSLSILLYFLFIMGLYLGLMMIPGLSSTISTSIFQSIFTMISTILFLATNFPNRVMKRVKEWLILKQQGQSNHCETPLEDQNYTSDEQIPMTYAMYRQLRFQEILRSKPTSMINVSPTMGTLRLVTFLGLMICGGVLVMIGINALPIEKMLNSFFVWFLVFGVGLLVISPLVMLEGFLSALINGLVIMPVLVLLTFVFERVVSLYPVSLLGFLIALSLFLVAIVILVYQGIKVISLRYTIALMMFKRSEVWLGVEQLLKASLPIENYDHMIKVEIMVDEQFELSELMILGPDLERYAHFRKIIFAGLHFDPFDQKAALYFCTKNSGNADRILNRFFKRYFHYPFTLNHLVDPLAILEERLTPTQEEMIEANNRNTVFHYEDEGIDLTELHHIIVILTFKDEVSSNQAILDLTQEGYGQTMMTDTRVENDLPASEDNGWFVISVQSETRLGLDRVNILTRQINQIIQPTQGKLSYWVLGKFQDPNQEVLSQPE